MYRSLFAELKAQKKLPNFIAVGAPRSGTTSLYYYLRQHPQVFLPSQKELHYFSYPQLMQRQGGPGDRFVVAGLCGEADAYASHYRRVKEEAVIGEISPSYLYFSDVAGRITEELGMVKILMILRNPMEKTFSQFMHMVGEGRETLSFEEALSQEEKRRAEGWGDIWLYTESSLYSSGLEKYLKVFGRANVKVIIFDDFKKDPKKILREVFQFLNINDRFICDTSGMFGKSGIPRMRWFARLIDSPNPFYLLARAMIPSSVSKPIKRRLVQMNQGAKPHLNHETRDRLHELFSQDISRLESLLDRHLNWSI